MTEMGIAILKRAAIGALWHFNSATGVVEDITPDELRYSPTFIYSGSSAVDLGEQVIIVDWAAISNIVAPGYAEATGHAVFALLMGGGLPPASGRGHPKAFLTPSLRMPLHFIGHSFGTVVNSEAIRRLGGLENVTVDQMTTLDPHDWDQVNLPIDGATLLPDVKIWSNVLIADNYFNPSVAWRPGGIVPCTPFGRPVVGAQQGMGLDLSSIIDPPTGTNLITLCSYPHSEVYAFYYGTINPSAIGSGQLFDGIAISKSWYQGDLQNRTGYVYSRLGGSQHSGDLSTVCRVDPMHPNPPAYCLSNHVNDGSNAQAPEVGDIVVDDPPTWFFGGDFSALKRGQANYQPVPFLISQSRYPGFNKAPNVVIGATPSEYVASLGVCPRKNFRLDKKDKAIQDN
jgi:hypothetical protein